MDDGRWTIDENCIGPSSIVHRLSSIVHLTPTITRCYTRVTTEYWCKAEVAQSTEARAAMGEAGESPALSRNCNRSLQVRHTEARMPASVVSPLTFARKG